MSNPAPLVDDYPIARIPEIPMWSENYAYSCNHVASGLSMIVLLGRWWADPTVWREVVSIVLPGGRMVCIKNYGRGGDDRIACGAMLRHEVIEPGRALKMVYNGPASAQDRPTLLRQGFVPAPQRPCRLEIAFDATTPVWDMSGHGGKTADLTGAFHIEQIGAGRGFVEFDGERFEFDGAFMNRDHSRGVRVLGHYRRHCWAQGYFPGEDVSFNVYAMEFHGVTGLAMANASVTQGGVRHAATIRDIELIRGRADAGQPYRMVLDSPLGTLELLKETTYGSIPISFMDPFDFHHGATPGVPSATMFEEAVGWSWGSHKGAGWSERAFALEPQVL